MREGSEGAEGEGGRKRGGEMGKDPTSGDGGIHLAYGGIPKARPRGLARHKGSQAHPRLPR